MSSISSTSMRMPDFSAMQQMRDKMFAKAGSDGGMTKADFAELTKDSPMAKAGGSKSADDFFKKVDADGDGKINQAELSQGEQSMMKEMRSTLSQFGGSGAGDGTPQDLSSLFDAIGGKGSHKARSNSAQGSGAGDQSGGANAYIQQLLARITAQLGGDGGATGGATASAQAGVSVCA